MTIKLVKNKKEYFTFVDENDNYGIIISMDNINNLKIKNIYEIENIEEGMTSIRNIDNFEIEVVVIQDYPLTKLSSENKLDFLTT